MEIWTEQIWHIKILKGDTIDLILDNLIKDKTIKLVAYPVIRENKSAVIVKVLVRK